MAKNKQDDEFFGQQKLQPSSSMNFEKRKI